MFGMLATRSLVRRALPAVALCLCAAGALAAAAGQEPQVSKPFKGPKVNQGTVAFAESGDQYTLTLSADFKVPDAPAPHWRVIDSEGNPYLLQRVDIKGDRVNRTITLPEYVPDLKKVQIWCAWAQVVLGETSFTGTIKLDNKDMTRTHVTSRFSGAKVKAGSVTHLHAGKQCTLTLSEDFVVPETPAPHWQVVDARGNTYLLDRLMVKGAEGAPDVLTRTIEVPAYVHDIVKVQIWCAWAETLLGEARFEKPVG